MTVYINGVAHWMKNIYVLDGGDVPDQNIAVQNPYNKTMLVHLCASSPLACLDQPENLELSIDIEPTFAEGFTKRSSPANFPTPQAGFPTFCSVQGLVPAGGYFKWAKGDNLGLSFMCYQY